MAPSPPPDPGLAWLEGGGECGALVRAIDWSSTPLGPIASWPASLRTTVGIVLHSRHPMFLWWGPELIQIYNDAYLPSFGKGKHPAAMGERGRESWQEIWPIIGPQIEDVMRGAIASWHEDALVPVWRNQRIEEVYWTYGYSPVFGESGGVAGTLVVCTETTARVVAARRQASTRALARNIASAMSVPAVLDAASQLFEGAPSDTPFALLYVTDVATGEPILERTVGLDEAERAAVDAAFRGSPVATPERSRLAEAGLLDLRSTPPSNHPWSHAATTAFVAPLASRASAHPLGYVVYGLSPRLPFDAPYREHLLQLGEHLGLALERIATYRVRDVSANERDNLLRKAPVATALFRGPEHVFELANDLYCRMVNRFDLVGKTYREAFPELVGTSLPGVLDRVFQTGEPFSSGEMLVPLDKRGDGTRVDSFFTFNLEALRDERGRIYGMMAVAVEITELVKARLGSGQAQVERESILRELQAANRAKDEFLAMLGHELRNPLSPIVTALHLMKRHGEGHATREQEIIERQVGHLVRLVDDLLDVSKITRGKITLRKEVVEIGDVVTKGLEMASDLLEQRRHRLSLDIPVEGLRVEADPVRLAQVVANLLTNAARYTQPGGTLSVRAGRDGDEAVLAVEDNGMGMSPGLLPRVFDLFVQGERGTDRKEGGLGLGLALVKSLVTLHGGTVTARSRGEGEGSTFEIRLATTAMPARGDARGERPTPIDGSSTRVLLVDDNVDSAEMLSEMLRTVGYKIAVAHDGPEALATAERFLPDIALLDIGLPVMDGYEVGRRLRASPRTSGCRLIALSGYGQEHDRARSHEAGFDVHLVKPVDVDQLLEVLARAHGAVSSRRP